MSDQPNQKTGDTVLYIRCKPDEKLRVIQHARKLGMKTADWARDVLMREIESETTEGERK